MSGTLPTIAGCEIAPAPPSAPSPYSRSSPGGEAPMSTPPIPHLSRKDLHTSGYSSAPALHAHGYSSPRQSTPAHICAPVPPPAAPVRTEESAHATPHTAFPWSARSPARTRSPHPLLRPPYPLPECTVVPFAAVTRSLAARCLPFLHFLPPLLPPSRSLPSRTRIRQKSKSTSLHPRHTPALPGCAEFSIACAAMRSVFRSTRAVSPTHSLPPSGEAFFLP